MKLRKLVVGAVTGVLACTGFSACSSGGGASRTIEVDYHNDQFAGAFLGYFPRDVTVTPGMTLKFHQTWSGEPHSVTMGTMVDKGLAEVPNLKQIIDDYHAGKALPEDAPPGYSEVFEQRLPTLFTEGDDLGQGAAHPCFVTKEADLPLNNKPCTKARQKPVPFTGRQAYYSSGFIPFQGPRGNSFDMKIADDAKDGTYFYYCNVHGAPMSGTITIKKSAKVESQATLNRRGKAQADPAAKAVLNVLKKERTGQSEFKGNLAGSGDESLADVEAFANEFTPHTIQATANTPVKWTFIGDHTITFNVPPYTPIFVFDKKDNLKFNEGLNKAKGGWPAAPEGRTHDGPPPPAAHLDAGKWDGSGGIHSSGSGWTNGDTYSVTFTKAGTYPYACLIHPGMIGKVVVK
jgi:plastocyanin